MKTVFAIMMLAIFLGTSPSANADDVDCSGLIGAVTVDGNVLIAATCSLDGTTVKGNVELFAGGSLTAQNVDVIGNIQGVDAFEVSVSDSDIGGSVQLEKLVGDATIRNNAIIGSIQLKENRFQLVADGNTVGADIQAFENFGGVDITSNTVDGNLQCKENDPAPLPFGANRVDGNKEDQCAEDLGF